MITLLLTETIDNLGIVGDVVTVKPGYARNFLMPRGYAAEPTEENIQSLAERRKQVEQEMRLKREHLEKMLEKLEGYEVTLERSANEQGVLFGGVSQHDIAEAMRGDGLAIEDRAVRVGQQIKRLDTYEIPIVLANDLKTEIKLWVVSDRPIEDQDETEAESEGESESGEQAGEHVETASES